MPSPLAPHLKTEQLALMLLLDELAPHAAVQHSALTYSKDRPLEYWFFLCDNADPPLPTESERVLCDSIRATADLLSPAACSA